ncbi:sugar ABC transporter ATPase [Paraburkholderia guartelaensis]|uniref:Sugar ABC transporter ATPase n=1 Tax=Paraburkholderia guartelaensis TaxID=2546446 RepID=A0A4R5LDI9_9BURK|nr:sugar ABC transporter ATPase [Paraburkholderia guartelaensis]TDG06199.1 sugar ABC transporter ATPase [Paraburkholderia guartelaensis]
MKSLTQRLLAATPLALIAACGSTPPSGTASNGEPMIYASSARSASSIASCLEERLPRVHTSRDGNTTEMSVGSRSDASYFVTLTPNGHGSVIRVTHGASASNDPPEEELRFDVARCTT